MTPLRLILATVVLGLSANPLAAAEIQFNRDIRPILSENCISCHGPDPGSRKAGMRLDTKEGIFHQTEKHGAVVTPGKLDQSELWRRITTTDEDDVMPPPKSRKVLKPEQKEMLKQWIQAGAPWQSHWSFIKPERPSLPGIARTDWVLNPIDVFILRKLEEKKLTPAPEADRRTLARRLYLDLTGLPPKPEEVEAFVKDRSPKAYELMVDRLLASPHYGEHRARYWLDAARYADTHGLHFDNYREIWPYRDWVIKAFNRNLPFDQFTIKQLAGDLLDDPTLDDTVATGFQRCAVSTNEGGTIEEENLSNYARERVETTGWVWLGLTANCAVCHDHKFDPITAKDHYALSAFFRNTTQGAFDGNIKQSQPSIPVVRDQKEWKRWNELVKQTESARKVVDEKRKDADKALDAWLKDAKSDWFEKDMQRGVTGFVPMKDGETNWVAGMAKGKPFILTPTSPLGIRKDGRTGGPAIIVLKGGSVAFPELGNYERDQPFSVSAWVQISKSATNEVTLFGRMEDRSGLRGWEVGSDGGRYYVRFVNALPDSYVELRSQLTKISRRESWIHLVLAYDGSGEAGGIRLYADGTQVDMELTGGGVLAGSLRTRVPFRLGSREKGRAMDGGSFQDVRFYDRDLNGPEAMALNRLFWKDVFDKPVKDWKEDDRKQLLEFYLTVYDSGGKAALAALQVPERAQRHLMLLNPTTLVQKEKKDAKPVANILIRGQYDKLGEKVSAATFGFLHPFPEGAPTNRLGLAKWIMSPENPLTPRVTVNRFWQEIFGIGIVKTAEDFGVMGETPVNQDLLDWLAVEFRESGWDMRHMIRLMVTSATYRQDATVTPEKLEKDPANRFLSRGPRFRMDAEMIRDYALDASGLLVEKIGGRSVKPYQPEGMWSAVAMPESNTRIYRQDQGDALYRRSMYTFWKRAAPPASMEVFNAPNRETCAVRRERSNTPLQALVTLNDPQFMEAARHLAQVALEHSRRKEKALDYMVRKVLLRPLDSAGMALLEDTYATMLKHYAAHPEDSRSLLKVGASRVDDALPAAELASMTMVANALFNLDEVLNK